MPLSQHLDPDPSAARMARVWGRVRERLEPAHSTRRLALWALASSTALTLMVALGSILARGRWAGSALENAWLETSGDKLSVTLLDGSEVTLGSRTRVQVAGGDARALTLLVARGQISCDVTHRSGRMFVVRASGVEVRVVGTRFSVSDEQRADGRHVEVAVERGAVEVLSARHPGGITRIAAGQSFSEWIPSEPQSARVTTAAPKLDSATSAPLDAERRR